MMQKLAKKDVHISRIIIRFLNLKRNQYRRFKDFGYSLYIEPIKKLNRY